MIGIKLGLYIEQNVKQAQSVTENIGSIFLS